MTEWPVRQKPTIDAALRDLEEGSLDGRLAALDALASADARDRERVAAALVAALDDRSPRVRAQAALALAEVDAASHVDSLLSLLSDRDGRVVQAAAVALGESGHPEAVAPLRALLSSPDADVRFQAVLSLARTAGLSALDDLQGMTQDPDPEVRANVAAALCDLGSARSLDLLAELLGDQSDAVRTEAAIGLAEHGDARGVSTLIEALDDVEVAPQAVRALGRLRAVEARERLREVTRKWLVRAPLKASAAAALAALGDPEGVAELARWLGARRREPRAMAIWSAGELRVRAVVDDLVAILDDRAHPDRDAAARALGQIGDERAITALRRATRDADEELADDAREALARIEGS